MGREPFGEFVVSIEAIRDELGGKKAKTRMEAYGELLAPMVDDAVRADLGDLSMSHWRRGNPIPITGDYSAGQDELAVTPSRRSVGLMRVLEDGRSAYAAGDKRASGRYTSKKTGDVRQKYRTVKRSTGATRGKGTWTDATRRLTDRARKVVPEVLIRDVLKAKGRT